MIIEISEGAGAEKELVELSVLDSGPLILQVGPNQNMQLEIQLPEISTAILGIKNISLRTTKDASDAIGMCDEAISFISELRSKLGAYQNRLTHMIMNLDNAEINNAESLSRIADTDIALEISNFTQQNIITQSAISVLAQSNQLSQQLLKILV